MQMSFMFLSVPSFVQIKHSIPDLSFQTLAPFYQNQAHLPSPPCPLPFRH